MEGEVPTLAAAPPKTVRLKDGTERPLASLANGKGKNKWIFTYAVPDTANERGSYEKIVCLRQVGR